jgi:hypothetical protein
MARIFQSPLKALADVDPVVVTYWYRPPGPFFTHMKETEGMKKTRRSKHKSSSNSNLHCLSFFPFFSFFFCFFFHRARIASWSKTLFQGHWYVVVIIFRTSCVGCFSSSRSFHLILLHNLECCCFFLNFEHVLMKNMENNVEILSFRFCFFACFSLSVGAVVG